MKPFMNDDFLLENETAVRLYHKHGAKMPIIDYHCHVNPEDIAKDIQYQSISQVWLGGDHYKWRLMRAAGLPESDITGLRGVDDWRLFSNFASCLPKALGNPIYHWAHLELKRYFNIDETLCEKTAPKIYQQCNQRLADPSMTVQGLIRQSNVKLLCTTDDPIDDLRWHRQLRDEGHFEVKVLPTFRPDKALNISSPDFPAYMAQLEEATGIAITGLASLMAALCSRLDYFHQLGCRLSDHALEAGEYEAASPQALDSILAGARAGQAPTLLETKQYRTAVLTALGGEYAKRGWVMQIHFGCQRNNNSAMFAQLGPDTGFDSMNGEGSPRHLATLLNAMDQKGQLPKTILYSLNAADTEVLVTIAGCFMANAGCAGKVQVGSAWWFNDTKSGMEKQLLDFANGSLLGNFVGMLTDSRSFLSYTRHEYFRRILCNFIGTQVEKGEYPADMEALGHMVEDICYNNSLNYFGFNL